MQNVRLSLLLASAAIAVVPHRFVVGQPAKADSVNHNFDYLDSLVRNKANQAGLDSLKAKIPAAVDLSAFPTTDLVNKKLDTTLGLAKAYAAPVSVVANVAALQAAISTKADKSTVFIPSSNNVLPDLLTISGSDPGVMIGDIQLFDRAVWIGSGKNLVSDRGASPSWEISAREEATGMLFTQCRSGALTCTNVLNLKSDVSALRSSLSVKDSVTVGKNLHVGGQIFASIGAISVPDYVFEPGYPLLSLPEVEAYTQANKHLPEVPSASEIEKGGLDLTQMNLTLLKKVEELTLHAIEQAKRLAAQQQTLQAQDARLQALEAKLLPGR